MVGMGSCAVLTKQVNYKQLSITQGPINHLTLAPVPTLPAAWTIQHHKHYGEEEGI